VVGKRPVHKPHAITEHNSGHAVCLESTSGWIDTINWIWGIRA